MSRLESFQGLDQSSQRHEKEIVVEFASDRLLHFLGVYFVILVAIVTKFTEITGQKLSCFPANRDKSYDLSFIDYANSYCWESFDITAPYNASSNSSTCSKLHKLDWFKGLKIIEDATFVKSFVQWLPYGMLVEAFLLALPSTWWHFRVGARLMGHLKFVQLFLEDIYNSVKDLPAGIKNNETLSEDGTNSSLSRLSRFSCPGLLRRRCQCKNKDRQVEEGIKCPEDCKCDAKLCDRDVFSSLCYENFASFMHQPYVTSVFKLTAAEKADGKTETKPLKSALMELWCHGDNFSGSIVVWSYRVKHVIGIVVSFISFCVMLVFVGNLDSNGWNSENFTCDVLYHTDICMICAVPRKMESVGFFFVTFSVTVLYFAISVWRLSSFSKKGLRRFSPEGTSSDFLCSTSDVKSVALLVAHLKKNED